ncbi:MAG TPA: exodeoxyribonuclease VII large subunit, partial [Spirochaetaceae bacterium]|nr:exodeoxyribonuclease VII large subunit [Spirochaetaceae bacterium]
MVQEEDICTVSEFNRYYSALLSRIPNVFYVRGEISQYKEYPSAAYFTIKDEDSSLDVIMFSNYLRALPFKPKKGDDVLVRGKGDLYQKTGRFSLKADMLRKFGIGEILERLRQLRERWRNTYFAKEKKPIPALVRNLFVVTSPQGSVIRDIIKTRNLRNKGASVHILPVSVQGSDCERTVSEMVAFANKVVSACEENGGSAFGLKNVCFGNSVLIVARGGGSFEDLLPFSSEAIVKSVCESKLPVISSIGHETEQPLCDLAADRRASTPTQAVELCLGEIDRMRREVRTNEQRLLNFVSQMISNHASMMESKRIRFEAMLSNMYGIQSNKLNRLEMEFDRFCENAVSERNIRLADAQRKFGAAMETFLMMQRNKVALLDSKLDSSFSALKTNFEKKLEALSVNLNLVSPYGILERGYSIISDKDGEIVSSPE